MCLFLENKQVTKQVAETNMTVYKVVMEDKDGLVTAYQQTPVEIGKTYRSKLTKEIKNRFQPVITFGLHSFLNLSSAIKDAKTYDTPNQRHFVVECVIPKGSYYYIGTALGCISYASNKIIYVKQITF
jgi:hypothetical protein